MEQIVHLLIALLTVVNTFYQYKQEREIRKVKAKIAKSGKWTDPHD